MAISADKKRLYTTTDDKGNPIGIQLVEMMACTGYYKRDTKGKRNLGLIIRNAPINMWAKNKPFVKVNQSTKNRPATQEERREANYGLSIPYATSPVILKTSFYNKASDTEVMNGWTRQIPRGTSSNEPLRGLDFDGYFHDAVCPFKRIVLPEASVNTWETSGFKIAIPTSSGMGETDSIAMTEIEAIKKYYFTIQLKHTNPSGNGIFIRTISADKPVGEADGGYINFSTYQLPKGVWDVIPFLSPIPFTMENDGNQVPASYRYYPIPKCYAGEMTISEDQYSLVYFDGFKNVYTSLNPVYGFSFNFAVRNNTANSHTFNDIIVRIRYPEKAFNDTLLTTETQVTINPFTVGAGQTVDYASTQGSGVFALKWVSANISEALYNNKSGIVVYIQLGSGQPVHKMFLRSSETDTPTYDPDKEYEPIVPEV